MTSKRTPKIAIVGPCSSGKSTLRSALHAAGFPNIANPAQEHSYVPDMWQKMTRPDILIYLDVDYPATLERRPKNDLGEKRVIEQKKRLAHAREHADFYFDTSSAMPDEVAKAVLGFLADLGA